jgi:signal transduction histidine kinase
MATPFSPTSRQERLIGAGRVVLAASSLLAVWLDPSEPTNAAQAAYGLLVAYLAYAVVVALAVARAETVPAAARLITHGVDIVFFSLFIYFTAGPASPFSAYFVFALVCATLRWQWRGTLWTAVVCLGAYLGAGLWFSSLFEDPGFELDRFIIRVVYLGVVAVLLGYLGVYEARVRQEMAALAVWPRGAEAEAGSILGEVLPYAGGVVGARAVLAVWTEGDEPWLQLASWSGGSGGTGAGEVHRERREPDAFDPLVPEALAEASFLSTDLAASPPSVLVRRGGENGDGSGFGRWHGVPLHPELARRHLPRSSDGPYRVDPVDPVGSVLSAPLRGDPVDGRIFFFGIERLTSDELVLAEVVAAVVRERLEHLHLAGRLRAGAATEERIRLARDLHDGVLQSMTGVALRLEAVRRQLEEDPETVRGALANLAEVQRLIALEQRDLRFFIQELKPSGRGDGASPALVPRIEELASRIEREWDLRVEVDTSELSAPVPEHLEREVYHLVREALINAARHGEASAVAVSLAFSPAVSPARGQTVEGADGTADGAKVAITVTDDGRGFPFRGRYADAALAELDLGPKSLRERVAALQGSLTVDSSPAGASVGIVLPPGAAP